MTDADLKPDIASKVEAYMQALVDLDRFSGSILVARNGHAMISKGYGFANREHGVQNTPKTKFRLGSVTKQFTAMAILILQNRGKLEVQNPVAGYIPNCPEAWEPVTVHHLLNHTSGMPEHTNAIDWQTTGRAPHTVQGVIDLFKDKPLDFRPGEQHRYSNSGYILLGHIIEQITGQSYEAFVTKNIFEPLGMENTGYDHTDRVLSHRASGYDKRGDTFVNAGYLDMSLPHAAGGLYSTVEDLLLWDQALYTDRLVPFSCLETMFMLSPFLANYGYGVGIGQRFGRRVIGHGGGIHGFLTMLDRYIEDKVCIIVLSNLTSAAPGAIAKTLAAIVFGEEYEVPQRRVPAQLASEIYTSYEGQYELAPGVILNVKAGEDRLVVTATGGGTAEFFPESEVRFFRTSSDDQITFCKSKEGSVTHLVLLQEGVDERGNRIG